nr:MAG TPA_asm: hypothetical protein [Caudoviricetes sp.]
MRILRNYTFEGASVLVSQGFRDFIPLPPKGLKLDTIVTKLQD